MTKPKNTFALRISLITALLLTLVLFIGYIAYQSYSKVITQYSNNTRPQAQLLSVKSILNNVASAEIQAKTFGLTNDSLFLEGFYHGINECGRKLNDLERLDLSKTQRNLADTLGSTIDKKFVTLNEMLLVQDQYRVQAALTKVISKIEDLTEEIDDDKNPQKKKEGLLKRLFGRKKDKFEPESAIEELNNEVKDFSEEEIDIELELKQKELELILKDSEISTKLAQILISFEKLEEERVREQTEEANETMTSAKTQIAIFCVVASILIVFMIITIYNYAQKNNQYKHTLNIAKTEAEELAIAKQRFLANVSHELRTPLNSIVGFSEQLSSTSLNQHQQEHLNIISESANHLLYVVDDVLDYSKLQSGKLSLENIPFSCKELCENVHSSFKPEAEKKGIELRLDLDPKLPDLINGDPHRLKQILLNLYSNSLKFTDKGSVILSVKRKSKSDNESIITFALADTGIGMKSKHLDTVFKEFEQADISTTRNYGGTGLGLSIVNMLVKLFDGTITINSKPKDGTTVIIALPFGHGVDLKKAPPLNPSLELPKGLKMLIVDDQPYNRKLLKAILKRFEVDIIEAENGKKALQILENTDVNLILMDTRMPVMNGIETTDKLRKTKRHRSTPILVVSAATEAEDIAIYKQAGATNWIRKPFKEDELLEKILPCLGLKNSNVDVASDEIKSDYKALVDFTYLKSNAAGDTSFYIDMLETFEKETKNGVQLLDEYLKSENWSQVHEEAHKISAPCKHMGALDLYRLLKTLEDNALKGDAKLLQNTLQNVKLLSMEVCDQVNQEIKEIKES